MKSSPVTMRAQGSLTFFKILFLISIGFISGCSENSAPETRTYSIYTMAKDYKEYIIQVDNLSSGKADPVKNGARTYPKQIWFDLIVRDGFYYRLHRKTHYFLKYTVQNNQYVPVDSVEIAPLTYLDNYNWVHPDTLLLISYDRKNAGLRYAKVNVKNMKARLGIMPVALPKAPFNSMSVGFSELRNKQLLVGYSYHSITSSNFSTTDTAYVDILSYPELKWQKTLKDSRSTYPGGANTAQPNTFQDEKGDFYFLACPGIALGNHPDKPTALYRIRKDENTIDSTFFWNISESIKNHGYGLWNIGNGKAILRSERRDLFTGVEDHYKVPHIEFYVLDLKQKTIKKLDLPLDKGTSRQCVLVEKGNVYISINSDTAGNYIWIYNPDTETLTKGLKLDGDIDYILRVEKLYED
ncbi:DUF4374 domain-containing protein [Dyadobacter subterraneus]|uniref:DUF4374 domain-containing protein n=1 Tax=Dyadobacter subterraneus TaxID=2773304 RepID=A0ABR9WD26_9BACT|nr:DUF4374 domain-containing protein [Dyadobacter subterraneus]MBE9463322.1 DUF4374 domain-containing protein [Dyadobacter subterraneus]